jgi:hypothetical protein
MSVSRLSKNHLLSLIKAADQRVPPGTVWTHCRTKKDLRSEQWMKRPHGQYDVIWARTVADFVRSFEQKQ